MFLGHHFTTIHCVHLTSVGISFTIGTTHGLVDCSTKHIARLTRYSRGTRTVAFLGHQFIIAKVVCSQVTIVSVGSTIGTADGFISRFPATEPGYYTNDYGEYEHNTTDLYQKYFVSKLTYQ